jgi:hypothetical protein
MTSLDHLESYYPASVREKELKQISSFIQQGSSCQVIGIPGVGRANLLGFLSYNRKIRTKYFGQNESSYHFVLINLAEIRQKLPTETWKFIFLQLVFSLKERGFKKEFVLADQIFRDSLSYNDSLVITQGLKRAVELLVYESKINICFLFERFETMLPSISSDFFTTLRSIRDSAKYKFSCIFSSTRPLESILEPITMADFYEFFAGHITYVPLLDVGGINFRISYLENLSKTKIPKDLL